MKIKWYYGKSKCIIKDDILCININLKKWNILLIILFNLSKIIRIILFKNNIKEK